MAVTITTALADSYFDQSSHIHFELWFSFDDEQRDGAIAHSTRHITREIGSDVTAETTYASSSYRPDYAVYEQALFLLTNSDAIPDGTQTGPKFYGDDGGGEQRTKMSMSTTCEEAQKWLDARCGAGVSILRG